MYEITQSDRIKFFNDHKNYDCFVMSEMSVGKLMYVFDNDMYYSNYRVFDEKKNRSVMVHFDVASKLNIPNKTLLNRLYDIDKCKVVFRRMSSVTDDEMDVLTSLSFSFNDFTIKDANYKQIMFLKEIRVDVPLWFGFEHPLTGKYACEVGLGIYK